MAMARFAHGRQKVAMASVVLPMDNANAPMAKYLWPWPFLSHSSGPWPFEMDILCTIEKEKRLKIIEKAG